MNIELPEFSLVVLVGASGSGKSHFAQRHFLPTEVISSDACRGLVADDEGSLEATGDAFEVLRYIAGKRLSRMRLTVVDATSVRAEDRKRLVELAREHHCLAVAIVLNLPEAVCVERNRQRAERDLGRRVVSRQRAQLRRSLRGLRREGFRYVYELQTAEEVEEVSIERVPLWPNRRHERGPFDIIGDVHGCADELEALLDRLGYRRDGDVCSHPEGRRVVFLGDLVDRGPRILDTCRLVRATVEAGHGLCVPGNHDAKLLRKLRGRKVTVNHGLDRTLAELQAVPEGERADLSRELADFLEGLVSHFVLDDGKLVVAHAGMKEAYQGRASGQVRAFALYGETTGETDEFGLPVRHDWAADYRGDATVVYGHTPVAEAEWLNRTINIDTGCVFGGQLTALRYPELELVAVPAARVYCQPVKPLASAASPETTAQQQFDDLLDMEDVTGKRVVSTGLRANVTIHEDQAAAALEAMSRFTVDPKWLIYLPPTMSPAETSARDDFLEHPDEALDGYRREGVERVVCQEKHMGSRAVVVLCRDAQVASHRFGVTEDGGSPGTCYTRRGRRFFEDASVEAEVLARLGSAVGQAGLWEELRTDWLCLDCELMPWSAKAQELLDTQYAAVGAAAAAAADAAVRALSQAQESGAEVGDLLEQQRQRVGLVEQYRAAYRGYCWDVDGLEGLVLAPFHLLASEGAVHVDRDHVWHMETLSRVCAQDPDLLLATEHRLVDLDDEVSCAEVIAWWEGLTSRGGEGMVVKPLDFVSRKGGKLLQPALKCRGREYLRIIYGPEYTLPENLERLRRRGLARKRSLALREYALGIEGMERFVRREPLRRVHECAFGVLALESDPIDPRL